MTAVEDSAALVRALITHQKEHGAYATIQAVIAALSADGSRIKINWRGPPQPKKPKKAAKTRWGKEKRDAGK